MEDQLISFLTAKLAKEKGFNIEQPKGYYNHGGKEILLWNDSEKYNSQKDLLCQAPTQSLLQKWLRENYKLAVYCLLDINGKYYWGIQNTKGKIIVNSTFEKDFIHFKSYEEALENGLQEALKLIK